MSKDSRIIDPRRWLSDFSLRQCSLAARGLAVDLACCMAQGEPYGHLIGAVEQVPRVLGVPDEEYVRLLSELETAGVFRRSESAALYWPSMVQDAERRAISVANGKRGGNPNVLRKSRTSEDRLG